MDSYTELHTQILVVSAGHGYWYKLLDIDAHDLL